MKDNNRLIAEFMGYEFTETPTYGILSGNKFIKAPKDDNKPPFNVSYGWNSPKYDKDWNLLIGVLHKISIITNDNYYEKQYLFQDYYLPDLNIEEVYENIIEFIEWYNNEKS